VWIDTAENHLREDLSDPGIPTRPKGYTSIHVSSICFAITPTTNLLPSEKNRPPLFSSCLIPLHQATHQKPHAPPTSLLLSYSSAYVHASTPRWTPITAQKSSASAICISMIKGAVISADDPDQTFLAANTITIFLDTQKNCVRGESPTMEFTGLEHGDMATVDAHHYIYLRSNNSLPNTPIYSYFIKPNSSSSSISD